MAQIVVLLERGPEGAPSAGARELLALAQTMGEVVAVLPIAAGETPEVSQLGAWGAERVHLVELDGTVFGAEAEALDAVAAEATALVLAPHTAAGRRAVARLAARRNWAVLTDATGVRIAGTDVVTEHQVLGGTAVVTAAAPSGRVAVTVRPGTPAPAPTAAAGRVSREQRPVAGSYPVLLEVLPEAASGRPALAGASRVVAGGRAFGSAEKFALVEQLADVLGAAVGASRAAVDAGYTAAVNQVGQTGTAVSADLYLALGISGAMQHLVGMQSSRLIVAVNENPAAPIFDIADFGIVGDVFSVVPALVDALNRDA